VDPVEESIVVVVSLEMVALSIVVNGSPEPEVGPAATTFGDCNGSTCSGLATGLVPGIDTDGARNRNRIGSTMINDFLIMDSLL
jgi:hypothetical protein